MQAFEEIQLSPGRYSQKQAERIDRKNSKLSLKTKTREYKTKRRERKEKRTTKNRQVENREGDQYQTGMGLRNESCSDQQREIPPPAALPEVKKINPAITSDIKRVFIDLETSSRGTLHFTSVKIC